MSGSTILERISTALHAHAAPAMNLDANEIDVVAFDDGIALLRLAGACASCPATITTIIMGLEAELRKHVPELELIEAVP